MDEEEIKRRIIFGEGDSKPPKETQFKKGQSGNPRGRPKKASLDLSLTDQPMLSAILDIANKMVPVREDGAMSEISMREAVIRATFAAAVKNISRSQDIVFRWLEKSDQANGPGFVGPTDAYEHTKLDETIRLRDTLIMQDELDHRSAVRLNGEPLTEPGSAALHSFILDMGVSSRLQLSETQRALKMMRYQGMSKRELLKACATPGTSSVSLTRAGLSFRISPGRKTTSR